jgi:hypothetical protein
VSIFSIATPFDALGLVLRIGSVGVAISSLELIVSRRDIGPAGLLGAEVQLARARWLVRTRLRALIAVLRAPTGALLVLVARLAAAALLIGGAGQFEVARIATLTVAVTTVLLRLRSPIGIHASGSMVMVTFTAGALGLLVGTDRSMRAALLFIALEAALSYFVAGSSKLAEPRWRHGQAIPLIAGTLMWGSRREALYLQSHPVAGLALGWLTILGECCVPLALVVPPPVSVAILVCAGTFHVVTAVAMRLNAFVWAFISTYPAILFCSEWLHHGF